MTYIYTLLLSTIFINPIIVKVEMPLNTNTSFSKASEAFVTDWETNESWQQTSAFSNKIYSIKRQLPQLTNEILDKGVVIVFAKGYGFIASDVKEKPIKMPFYMFTSGEITSKPCSWMVSKQPGEVKLDLQLPEQLENNFTQQKNEIAFRYFLIDETFLKKHKVTKSALLNMNYNQIVQIVKVMP